MATPFLGMRGTGDWGDNVRPENFREAILYLYPNGSTPITGVMSMQAAEPVNDPVFHWFERGLPAQTGAVAGVFKDPTLSTAYTAGDGTTGSVVYAKVAQAVAEEFRVGHQVMFEKQDTLNGGASADARHEVQGEVVNVMLAGDNSYVSVRLHEDPNNTYDLDGIDTLSIIGNLNEEGADMPDPITYDPDEYYNYTQIWRTALSLTRTARKTRIRYGSDAYKLAKQEALELHAIEMEKSAIWGKRWAGTGPKNQPKRATGGLIWAIRNFAPANVIDYRYDTAYSGLTWAQGGEDWLNTHLTRLMSKGSDEKMAVGGYGAMKGINELVALGSEFTITSREKAYGLRVNEWVVSNGVLNMKTHPLFGERLAYRSALLIYEPQRFRFRYIDDTDFISDPPDKKNRNNGRDATDEEYLTEGGFEYHNAETAMLLLGVGEDNTLGG